jgi:hypothetical protein
MMKKTAEVQGIAAVSASLNEHIKVDEHIGLHATSHVLACTQGNDERQQRNTA